jgi:hypothetical protein
MGDVKKKGGNTDSHSGGSGKGIAGVRNNNVVTTSTVGGVAGTGDTEKELTFTSSPGLLKRRLPPSMVFTPISSEVDENSSKSDIVSDSIAKSAEFELASDDVPCFDNVAPAAATYGPPMHSPKLVSNSVPCTPARMGGTAVSIETKSSSYTNLINAAKTATTAKIPAELDNNIPLSSKPSKPAFFIPGGDDPLKKKYSVPESYSYGHCDILGGKHAEQVWERIVEWLDVTSQREREWRYKRRYSAK